MTLPELLTACGAAGLRLAREGNGLVADGPRGGMTPGLTEGLRLHKLALLAALADSPGPCPVCRSAIVVRTPAGSRCPSAAMSASRSGNLAKLTSRSSQVTYTRFSDRNLSWNSP